MNSIISNGTEQYLAAHGMQVIERNWRCAMGEADFVCLDGGQAVLVNLKFGLRPDDGEIKPEEAARLRRIALFYLAMHPNIDSVRFDLIMMDVHTDKITKQTMSTYQV